MASLDCCGLMVGECLLRRVRMALTWVEWGGTARDDLVRLRNSLEEAEAGECRKERTEF